MSTAAPDRSPAKRKSGNSPASVRLLARLALKTLLYGLVTASVHGLFKLVHWQSVQGYLLVGLAMTLAEWGGDLLHRNAILQILRHAGRTVTYLSRVPFSFFSGAAGYVVGMLVAKKLAFLGFYDIPVRPLFLLGGLVGSLLQPVIAAAESKWLLYDDGHQHNIG